MPKTNKYLISIISTGLIIIFSLLVVSVYQLNTYTSEIYFIRNSEKKINQLSQENKTLEVNLAEVSSLVNLGKYVQSFEKAGRIEYLRLLEGTAWAR